MAYDMKTPYGYDIDRPTDDVGFTSYEYGGYGDEGIIYGDTQNDKADMLRLGKQQQFKRNFGFISTLGFISIYMVRPVLSAWWSILMRWTGNVGICAGVLGAGIDQRWFRRTVLDIHCHRDLLLIDCCQPG
jgi:hypothetical protein